MEKGTSGLRKTASQGLVCLSLVDDLVFFSVMFLRFAGAYIKHSENLRLIRGGKKRGPLKIKNTSPKLSNDDEVLFLVRTGHRSPR